MSNRDDVTIVDSKDPFLFSAASRTAYAFHGSFAAHAVRSLPRSEPFDRRFSLVLFYEADGGSTLLGRREEVQLYLL